MSNEIFPSLPGLKWSQTKVPIFATRIQISASGRESRVPLFVYPLYQFNLAYELLRDTAGHNELKSLMGFYLQRGGASEDFLYIDISDNYVLAGLIGVGDGNNNQFQMVRSYGGFYEPRYDIQANNATVPTKIYVNGNEQANNTYSISYLRSGILSFNSNPIGAITGDFAFYYRVRFIEYSEDRTSPGGSSDGFSQFMKNLWEAKTVSLVSVRPEGNIFLPDPTLNPPNAIMINMLFNNQSSNLYQGANANDPSTAGWGANELGYWWLNTSDPHYKWWNGNEILILG